MDNQNLEVATTIKNQLFCLGKIKVWSWGSHNWSGGKDYLLFSVNGFKFRGKIKITLDPCDYYIIEFFKPRSIEVIHKVDMCYFDQMVDIIDEYVEFTGDNYPDDVAKAVYAF